MSSRARAPWGLAGGGRGPTVRAPIPRPVPAVWAGRAAEGTAGRIRSGGEACKAGGCTGGGSSSAGAGRFLPCSEVAPAAGCWAAAADYVKRSVAGRDRNNNDVVDAQNTPKARRKVILNAIE